MTPMVGLENELLTAIPVDGPQRSHADISG